MGKAEKPETLRWSPWRVVASFVLTAVVLILIEFNYPYDPGGILTFFRGLGLFALFWLVISVFEAIVKPRKK